MLASTITAIVRYCTRFPWPIIALAIIGAVVSGVYSARHFAINTDVNKLISPDLDWRKRDAEFEKAFPGHFGSALVVVDAPIAVFAARGGAVSSGSRHLSSNKRPINDLLITKGNTP